MRLQSLSKALCPLALAAYALAIAQEPPVAEPEPAKDPKAPQQETPVVPPAATPEPQLEPAKPIEEIPADPSRPVLSPEDQAILQSPGENTFPPAGPLPEATPEPLDQLQPTPYDASEPLSGNDAAAIPASSTTAGPDVDAILASVLANRDVATPNFVSSDRDWLRGLTFGGDLSATYDTNVYQTSGLRGVPKTDDFILGFKPFVAYGSERYGLTYNAKLVVDAEDYIDNDDLSAVGYTATFSAGYEGKKLVSLVDLYLARQSNIDRNYGGFVERNIFRIDTALSYKLSHKTSIDGKIGYSIDDPQTRNFYQTTRDFANIAVSWQESPLLKIGAGLGWTRSEGERQATRDTVGPLLRLKYTLSKKLSFEGETGLDFVSYDTGGGDDLFWSGKIAAKYVPSKFWTFDLSLLKDAEPDGAVAGSYRDFVAIRAGVQKKIYKATVMAGFGYETNQYTRQGGASVAGLDRDYYTFDLSVKHPIYRDMVDLEIFTKFSDEEADSAARTWSGSQYGVAIKSKF